MAYDPLASLLAPYNAAIHGDTMNTTDPIYALLNPPARHGGGEALSEIASGPGGNIEAQLRAGFLKAGRPDLARMVGTAAFDKWVGAESGWDPTAVSPANNNGQRNGGLFQFWYGHDFSDPYEGQNKFTATPYQQAIMAAQNFGLTAGDIKDYAHQINQGSYGGWG